MMAMEEDITARLVERNKSIFHRAACMIIYQFFKRRLYIESQRLVEEWKESTGI